jgi:hypothetical protein
VPAVDSPNFRPARPPRLVSGTSTSMGGFPFRECGSGVSNRYNLDYCALRPISHIAHLSHLPLGAVDRISWLRRRGWAAPRRVPQREGGPGAPNPSQLRARLPPPGAPGEVRHERDNGTPAAEAAPRN